MAERAHEPTRPGWFTNTSSPRADIKDWCRTYPGLRVEIGPPMVSEETYPMEQMVRLKIGGLYARFAEPEA